MHGQFMFGGDDILDYNVHLPYYELQNGRRVLTIALSAPTRTDVGLLSLVVRRGDSWP
jgi:hypothetical protein